MACLPSSLCSVCLDGALSGLVRWAGGSLLFLVMAFLILGEGEGERERLSPGSSALQNLLRSNSEFWQRPREAATATERESKVAVAALNADSRCASSKMSFVANEFWS